MISILFVCLGNICRSPALEATLKKLAKEQHLEDQLFIDSCAVNTTFLGQPADTRMRAAAEKRGISIETTAKLFQRTYFKKFDYIFVIDNDLLKFLKLQAPDEESANKVHLATEFSSKYKNEPIADPYYYGKSSFDRTMDMAEDACKGIIQFLEKAKK